MDPSTRRRRPVRRRGPTVGDAVRVRWPADGEDYDATVIRVRSATVFDVRFHYDDTVTANCPTKWLTILGRRADGAAAVAAASRSAGSTNAVALSNASSAVKRKRKADAAAAPASSRNDRGSKKKYKTPGASDAAAATAGASSGDNGGSNPDKEFIITDTAPTSHEMQEQHQCRNFTGGDWKALKVRLPHQRPSIVKDLLEGMRQPANLHFVAERSGVHHYWVRIRVVLHAANGEVTLDESYVCDYDAQNETTKEDPRDGNNPNRPSNQNRAGLLKFPKEQRLRQALKPWVHKTERLYLYHRRTGHGAVPMPAPAAIVAVAAASSGAAAPAPDNAAAAEPMGDECAICLEVILNEASELECLGCHNMGMHRMCLMKWKNSCKRKKKDFTCPLCRCVIKKYIQ